MILKYRVPLQEKSRYGNKNILYCEVLDKINLVTNETKCVYKVKLLNNFSRIGIFSCDELKKINLIDRLIIFFKK